ncbi:hypothetical protein TraAM80_07433 [Trypanosoma rangeli]|uniref:Uncharacterized protein n=1 Tax=Trypanosoma rangeli TaxID=5698 RepID=A0A422N5J2_TRYRA|nr:uncharacterized protein TraAM80_07433 [Trypanosoma rangeli]RNF00701.1 hypothetical protein TraAM80_07433 [Trypanosoma rangeli]|eukprot:RNF00701.1 hypothetical protein TraAM80_07433 [Trypanosoma rangeli]
MHRCGSLLHRIEKVGRAAWVHGASLAKETRHEGDSFSEVDTTALCFPFSSSSVSSRLMTTEEALRRISSFYRPDTYAYSLLSTHLLFHEARDRGFLELNVDARGFFVHPATLIRHPEMFSHFFGVERSPFFSEMLQQLLATHDAEKSPVVQECHSQGVDPAAWVPFLRGLCLCVIVGDPILSEVGFVIEDLLLRGALHKSLSIPGEHNERGISIAGMLLEAAVELGSVRLSELSLCVYRQFLAETSYAVSKRLAVCFTQNERRQLDWDVRCLSRKQRGCSRVAR